MGRRGRRWQYAGTRLPAREPSLEPWLALLRAVLCRDGVEQMRADADEAGAGLAAGSFVRGPRLLYQGVART